MFCNLSIKICYHVSQRLQDHFHFVNNKGGVIWFDHKEQQQQKQQQRQQQHQYQQRLQQHQNQQQQQQQNQQQRQQQHQKQQQRQQQHQDQQRRQQHQEQRQRSQIDNSLWHTLARAVAYDTRRPKFKSSNFSKHAELKQSGRLV